MNIKIITCHYAYNYGAVLQTYALFHFLTDQGNNVEIINYKPYYYKGSTSSKSIIKRAVRRIIRIPDHIKSEIVFNRFLCNHVSLTKECKSYKELLAANFHADVYIAGSDQIWNFNLPNGWDDAFYLKFVDGNKISYAASLGSDIVSEEQISILKERLKDFNKISVREKTTEILFKQFDINATTVVDPVFLLTKEEWEHVAKNPAYPIDSSYILIYAFNRQSEIFSDAKLIAQKYNLKVYSINTFWEDVFFDVDHYFWNCSPNEFLYLLKNATIILTNSFHGLSFSLIFNKRVICYDKNDHGNTRMHDLMDLFQCGDECRYKKELNISEFNFSSFSLKSEKIKEIINQERIKAMKFLNDV